MSQFQVIRRLLQVMAPMNGIMAVSIAARVINFLGGVALVAIPIAGVALFIRQPDVSIPIITITAIVAVALVKAGAHYLETYTGHDVAFRLLVRLRTTVYQSLEPLVPAASGDLRSGDAVSTAIDDCNRIEPFYAHTVAPLCTAIIAPLVLAVVLALLNPLFAMVYVAVVVVMMTAIPWLMNRAGSRGGEAWRRVQGDVSAVLTDSLQGLRDTVAFDYGRRRRDELWAMGEVLQRGQAQVSRADAFQRGLTEVLVFGAGAASLAVGAWLAGQGAIDPLLAIPLAVAITVTGLAPVWGFSNVLADYRVAIVAARRLFELIDTRPAVTNPADPAAPPATPAVEFDTVRFAYQDRAGDVLQGVSFRIEPGARVSLVGASGSGKSTIASLLLRFWDPQDGAVRIGGVDLRDLDMDAVRSLVGIVSQRSWIFNSTIGENIRMGRPDASPEDVDEAARRAGLLDWIRTLPDGYDTPVGEMGSRLSGGQRQRVAIARTLLKDAPILILDEATSSLDVETEREVNAAISELARGRTVLTIAHRLSTVRTSPTILVLDQGQIVERGTHEELLARNSVYARLFTMQQDEIDEHAEALTQQA